MAEELRLKTHHSPSIFNKDMFLGAFAGSLIYPGLGALVGGAIGGFLGKNRQEKENREGKIVSEPSAWNKDTLIGGIIGNAVGAVAAIAILVAGGLSLFSGAPLIIPLGAGLAAMGSFAAGIIGGAWIGGQLGKKRMEREYEEAKVQKITQQISQNVSPEMAQAVEYRMTHDKQWAKQIGEEKIITSAQTPVRE